jgi:hypothetical protein
MEQIDWCKERCSRHQLIRCTHKQIKKVNGQNAAIGEFWRDGYKWHHEEVHQECEYYLEYLAWKDKNEPKTEDMP